MPATPAIEIVSDANIALKWFHADGEEEVEPARLLLAGHRNRSVALCVLDLTRYELGNALLRGRLGVSAAGVMAVLDALAEICPAITPTRDEFHLATEFAEEHHLTVYDAVYAAVARNRGAQLATLDSELLRAGLGRRPSELATQLEALPGSPG